MSDAATIVFREAEPGDIEPMADVLSEVQAHYRVPSPPREAIIAGLKRRPAGTRILLANDRTEIASFACFSGIYPGPALTPGFFLKELFVRTSWRGTGVGKALMAELARMATCENIARIDWTADADDRDLLGFYEALGGSPLPAKRFFRLKGDALAGLAKATGRAD